MTDLIIHTERLSPLSVGKVSRVQQGTDTLQQIELIQLFQNPLSVSNPANPVAPAGSTVASQVSGVVSLNTLAVLQAFNAHPERARLTFFFEVQLQWPGEDPLTVLRLPVVLERNVLDLGTLVSQTVLGTVATFSALVNGIAFNIGNSITTLRGGTSPLEAVATATLPLGSLWTVEIEGRLSTWLLAAGSADPTDPVGQVQPLDHNPGTNNKYWKRGAGTISETGLTPLTSGQNTVDVVFATPKPDTYWSLTYGVVENTVDANPLELNPPMIIARSVNGFTVAFNGAPDTANYKFRWRVDI